LKINQNNLQFNQVQNHFGDYRQLLAAQYSQEIREIPTERDAGQEEGEQAVVAVCVHVSGREHVALLSIRPHTSALVIQFNIFFFKDHELIRLKNWQPLPQSRELYPIF
jgi:hypothetical protein